MAQLLILERETLNKSQSLFIDGRPEIIDLRQSFVVVAILLKSQSTLFFSFKTKQCIATDIFLFLNGFYLLSTMHFVDWHQRNWWYKVD
jgi:hypothetical protein